MFFASYGDTLYSENHLETWSTTRSDSRQSPAKALYSISRLFPSVNITLEKEYHNILHTNQYNTILSLSTCSNDQQFGKFWIYFDGYYWFHDQLRPGLNSSRVSILKILLDWDSLDIFIRDWIFKNRILYMNEKLKVMKITVLLIKRILLFQVSKKNTMAELKTDWNRAGRLFYFPLLSCERQL